MKQHELSGVPYYLAPVCLPDRDAIRVEVGARLRLMGDGSDWDQAERETRKDYPGIFEAQQIADPEDARFLILEPLVFSDASRRRWWAVCSRQAEWSESKTARGPLPPCMAHWTRPFVQDCPEDMRQTCSREALNLAFAQNRAERAMPDITAADVENEAERAHWNAGRPIWREDAP